MKTLEISGFIEIFAVTGKISLAFFPQKFHEGKSFSERFFSQRLNFSSNGLIIRFNSQKNRKSIWPLTFLHKAIL